MANVQFFKGSSIPNTINLPEGGLYFNTDNKKIYMNNNTTIIEYNSTNGVEMEGINNTCSSKAYYISGMYDSGLDSSFRHTLYLWVSSATSSAEKSPYQKYTDMDTAHNGLYNESFVPDITVEDRVSIINGSHYNDIGKVVWCSGNELQIELAYDTNYTGLSVVDKYFSGDVDEEGNLIPARNDWADDLIWCPDKPEAGFDLRSPADAPNPNVPVLGYAFAGGHYNKASGEGAFVVGTENVATGNQTAIFGKMNRGGYGSFITGIQNVSYGVHTSILGRNITNYGDYNACFNYAHHVEGTYNLVAGRGCTVYGVQNVITGYGNKALGNADQDTQTGNISNFVSGHQNELLNSAKNSVSGQANNISNSSFNIVSGSLNKLTSNSSRNIIGGWGNICYDSSMNIVGGNNNNISSTECSTINGLNNNLTNSSYSMVAGTNNTIKAPYMCVSGDNLTTGTLYGQAIFGKWGTVSNDKGFAYCWGNKSSLPIATIHRGTSGTHTGTYADAVDDTDLITKGTLVNKFLNKYVPSVDAVPKNHASSDDKYGPASDDLFGHVQLANQDLHGVYSGVGINGIAAGTGHTHSNYTLQSDFIQLANNVTDIDQQLFKISNGTTSVPKAVSASKLEATPTALELTYYAGEECYRLEDNGWYHVIINYQNIDFNFGLIYYDGTTQCATIAGLMYAFSDDNYFDGLFLNINTSGVLTIKKRTYNSSISAISLTSLDIATCNVWVTKF